MPVTRRRFLSQASVTVLASAVMPAAIAQSSSPFFDNISAETFTPFVGDRFNVSLNGVSRGFMTLTGVVQSPPPPAVTSPSGAKISAPSMNTFRLNFHRGGQAPLTQDTYTMSQISLGSFPLFLVPLAVNGATSTYVAVFNLLEQ